MKRLKAQKNYIMICYKYKKGKENDLEEKSDYKNSYFQCLILFHFEMKLNFISSKCNALLRR